MRAKIALSRAQSLNVATNRAFVLVGASPIMCLCVAARCTWPISSTAAFFQPFQVFRGACRSSPPSWPVTALFSNVGATVVLLSIGVNRSPSTMCSGWPVLVLSMAALSRTSPVRSKVSSLMAP